MDIKQFGKGAVRDEVDVRDYQFSFGAIPLPENYSVFDTIPVKVENQNGSSSCVAQAVSKYAEVLNGGIDLSAKFIYSRIFLPTGGAQIRDGIALMVSKGTCDEVYDPSYESGNPPSESYMRQINDRPETTNSAISHEDKEYQTLPSNDIRAIQTAIYQNKGVVSGFEGDDAGWLPNGNVTPPTTVEWAHAVYLCGWQTINGKVYIQFLNSWSKNWGINGFGLVDPSYWSSGHAFNLWTLTPKTNTMRYTIDENKNQYVLYDDLKIAIEIGNPEQLAKFVANGLTGTPTSILSNDLVSYIHIPGIDKNTLKDLFNL